MTNPLVFVITESTRPLDRMDAEYVHPERVNMLKKLRELEKDGIIELRKLNTLFTVSKDKMKASSEEVLPCIEMQNVDVDYGLVNIKNVKVAHAGTSTVSCKGNQILFSGIRPYLNKIALLHSNVNNGICSREFLVLSPIAEKTSTGYLWLVLRSNFVLSQSKHLSGGSLRPRIDDNYVADLEIPVLKDSSILSEIDSSVHIALEKYYTAQTKLKTAEFNFLNAIGLESPPKLSGLFFDYANPQSDSPRPFYRMDPLFFHPSYYEELKGLLEQWAKSHNGNVLKLEALCVPDGIKRRKARLTSHIGSIPRLGVENITENGILWDCERVGVKPKQNQAYSRKGDILITSTGVGSTGKIAIYDEETPSVTDGHITIVRTKPEINSYYLLAYLKCEYARRQLSRLERGSSGQIELYAEDIKNVLVPIPKDDDKNVIEKAQTKVREALDEIKDAKDILRRARIRLDYILTKSPALQERLRDDVKSAIPEPEWKIIRL